MVARITKLESSFKAKKKRCQVDSDVVAKVTHNIEEDMKTLS